MDFFAQKAPTGEYVKLGAETLNQPIVMKIVDKYNLRQARFKNEPLLDFNGAPKMEAVIPVEMEDGSRKTFSDGGKRRLQSLIGQAVKEAGASGLELGGVLTVTFIGKTTLKNGAQANDYKVEYKSNPEGGSAMGEVIEPQAEPTPAPSQQQQGGFQQQGFQQQQQPQGNYGNPQGGGSPNPWGNYNN